jgi:hypothetical protein
MAAPVRAVHPAKEAKAEAAPSSGSLGSKESAATVSGRTQVASVKISDSESPSTGPKTVRTSWGVPAARRRVSCSSSSSSVEP